MKIYNTLTRSQEEFESLQPGKVSMYTCGPTVYDFAHIGNFRAYLWGDLLRRAFEYHGFEVTQVMNITDIEDKIIGRMAAEGRSLEEVVAPFIACLAASASFCTGSMRRRMVQWRIRSMRAR